MRINHIGNPFSGRIQENRQRKGGQGGSFQERLLTETRAGKQDRTVPEPEAVNPGQYPYQVIPKENTSSTADAAELKRADGRSVEAAGAVKECPVLDITYEQSDFSKVYVKEGFSIKAKAAPERGLVYLEQKSEDGTVKAYEADPHRLSPDTDDAAEQAALKAWEQAGKPEEDLNRFHKELLAFYERVKDRIKNGPPKIQTGGSAFGVKEWEKLLEKIDSYLEAVRREQEARDDKEHRKTDGLLGTDDAVWKIGEEKGNEEIDPALLEKLLEDRAIVIGPEMGISGSDQKDSGAQDGADTSVQRIEILYGEDGMGREVQLKYVEESATEDPVIHVSRKGTENCDTL